MYKVIWIDLDGEQKSIRGFKTQEEGYEYINNHSFIEDDNPLVVEDK